MALLYPGSDGVSGQLRNNIKFIPAGSADFQIGKTLALGSAGIPAGSIVDILVRILPHSRLKVSVTAGRNASATGGFQKFPGN